ncbi:hypothetical protein PV04_08381 [Phialophora macrospora]|uniref:Uncharacterized protein n=1 Tax=Phialophora macrospora TaxID=1851006 RepID=A0A0D2FHA5_9EURO|nr:hypothetical protein PV04_08381 [Phialophora macrospora]
MARPSQHPDDNEGDPYSLDPNEPDSRSPSIFPDASSDAYMRSPPASPNVPDALTPPATQPMVSPSPVNDPSPVAPLTSLPSDAHALDPSMAHPPPGDSTDILFNQFIDLRALADYPHRVEDGRAYRQLDRKLSIRSIDEESNEHLSPIIPGLERRLFHGGTCP